MTLGLTAPWAASNVRALRTVALCEELTLAWFALDNAKSWVFAYPFHSSGAS